MRITRRSPVSRVENIRDIPCTQEQYAAWEAGAFIQDAMPNVSAEDREFIISGITPEEWNAVFDDGLETIEDVVDSVEAEIEAEERAASSVHITYGEEDDDG